MSKMMILLISSLLFCCLNIIVTLENPSINVYVNQKVDFAFTKKDLHNILNNFALGQSFDGIYWSYLEVGTLYNGRLNITNFTASVNFNEDKLIFSEVSDGFYISGNDSITITLLADFTATTELTTSPTGKITIQYTTQDWYFMKRVYKQDTNISVDCSVTTGFNLNWTINYNKSDTLLIKYINNTIQNNATLLQDKFLSDFNNYSLNYYKSDPNATKIPIQTSYPNKTYTVDMSFWSNPFYDLQRDGVIYYFNGDIDKDYQYKSKGFLKNEIKNSENWDNFSPSDGNYQVFFSSNFFFNLINRIVSERAFNISLTQDKVSLFSPFRLDINSLGQFYPGVYNSFPRDNLLNLEGSIISVNFNQTSLSPIGQVSILFTLKLKSDETLVLQWINYLSMNAHYTYENQTINFILEHNVSVVGTTILQNPYGYVDVNVLDIWVESTFKLLNDFTLLNKGIDFNQIFEFSEMSVKRGNGILVYGSYMLPKSKLEFKKLIEEKIKYIN